MMREWKPELGELTIVIGRDHAIVIGRDHAIVIGRDRGLREYIEVRSKKCDSAVGVNPCATARMGIYGRGQTGRRTLRNDADGIVSPL